MMKKSITVKSKNARSEKVGKKSTGKQSYDTFFSGKEWTYVSKYITCSPLLSMSVDILQLKYS